MNYIIFDSLLTICIILLILFSRLFSFYLTSKIITDIYTFCINLVNYLLQNNTLNYTQSERDGEEKE